MTTKYCVLINLKPGALQTVGVFDIDAESQEQANEMVLANHPGTTLYEPKSPKINDWQGASKGTAA